MLQTIIIAALAGAPIVGKDFKLACPAGTRQARTDAYVGCHEVLHDGELRFNGPFVSLYKSGAVEAVGQSDHGFRSGKWALYDEKGVLVGETEFKHGNFHGRRVFYSPEGRVISEEFYDEGRRVPPPASGGTALTR